MTVFRKKRRITRRERPPASIRITGKREKGRRMWYNLFETLHQNMGMHFWDLPAIIAGVVLIIMLVVHNLNQKKRENRYDKKRSEKLEAMGKNA